jgi:hypothetical protein
VKLLGKFFEYIGLEIEDGYAVEPTELTELTELTVSSVILELDHSKLVLKWRSFA